MVRNVAQRNVWGQSPAELAETCSQWLRQNLRRASDAKWVGRNEVPTRSQLLQYLCVFLRLGTLFSLKSKGATMGQPF